MRMSRPMRWLINVESANPLPVSVYVDFNLLDGCKADAFSSPNVPCDIDKIVVPAVMNVFLSGRNKAYVFNVIYTSIIRMPWDVLFFYSDIAAVNYDFIHVGEVADFRNYIFTVFRNIPQKGCDFTTARLVCTVDDGVAETFTA